MGAAYRASTSPTRSWPSGADHDNQGSAVSWSERRVSAHTELVMDLLATLDPSTIVFRRLLQISRQSAGVFVTAFERFAASEGLSRGEALELLLLPHRPDVPRFIAGPGGVREVPLTLALSPHQACNAELVLHLHGKRLGRWLAVRPSECSLGPYETSNPVSRTFAPRSLTE